MTKAHWFKKRQLITTHYKYLLNLTNTQITKIFNNHDVKSFIQDFAFAQESGIWLVGSKCAAIGLLSKLDTKEAFAAAKKAFQNPSSHDRNIYPYLLIDIDKDQGIKILIEQCKREENRAIRYAICRVLAGHDIVSKLKKMIESEDFKERKTAYSILSWQTNPNIRSILYYGLADPIEEVSEVARDGILRHKQQQNVNEIVKSFNIENDNNQKWIYLDLLLEFADPGDIDQDYPNWAKQIWENTDLSMRRHLLDQLKDKRKELKKTLR